MGQGPTNSTPPPFDQEKSMVGITQRFGAQCGKLNRRGKQLLHLQCNSHFMAIKAHNRQGGNRFDKS